MATHTKPFDQVPLSKPSKLFRLLSIGESKDNRIVCSFQIYEIEQCPPFIALSYAWGPELPTKTIHLQGCPFTIRENLYLALSSIIEHKRRQSPSGCRSAQSTVAEQTPANLFDWIQATGEYNKETFFWIDQLCINQDDVHEKNEQIPVMAKIYSRAFGVLVWLGKEQNDSAFAIPKVRRRQWSSPDDDAQLGQAVGHLLARPYWERMWIIQEFFLAKRVVILCGFETFTPEDLYAVIDGSKGTAEKDRRRISVDNGYSSKVGLKMIRRYSSSRNIDERVGFEPNFLDSRDAFTQMGSRLIDLMVNWGQNKCHNPRDKVYGLLRLLGPDFPYEKLRPDYEKPVEDLFVDVVHVVQTTCEKTVAKYDRFWTWLIHTLGVSVSHPTIKGIMEEAWPKGKGANDAGTNEASAKASSSNIGFEGLTAIAEAIAEAASDLTITEISLITTEWDTSIGMEIQAKATEDCRLLHGSVLAELYLNTIREVPDSITSNNRGFQNYSNTIRE